MFSNSKLQINIYNLIVYEWFIVLLHNQYAYTEYLSDKCIMVVIKKAQY